VSALEAAFLFWFMANTYGTCHSVSVAEPVPQPMATLFDLNDWQRR
jgi:hypothetical protein